MLYSILLLILFALSASAHTAFVLPTTSSCPMAHCSNFAGSQNPMAPPTLKPGTGQSDTNTGRSLGLGCVSNGTFVACTYGASDATDSTHHVPCADKKPRNTLVIYDAAGNYLYNSNCLLDDTAQSSVPMMNTNGDVIMTDQQHIVRINRVSGSYPPEGVASACTSLQTLTSSPSCSHTTGTSSGVPYSPILLNNNTMVVVATGDPGFVYAFWADDLSVIASTQVNASCSTPPSSPATCLYETHNTPAASYNADNRFYVSMNAATNTSYGLLAAFEVGISGSGVGSITMPWSSPATFGGPSGASPAVVKNGSNQSDIYFDGGALVAGNTGNGYGIAVTDNGTSYSPKWHSAVGVFPTRIPLSGAVDNFSDGARNCVWWYYLGSHVLSCLAMDTTASPPVSGGDVVYSIDVQTTTGITDLAGAFLSSGITLTRPAGGGTVLIVGVNSTVVTGGFPTGQPGRILAIKLEGNGTSFHASNYWGANQDLSLPLPNEWVATQFPIVTSVTPSFQGIATPSTRSRAYILH